MCSFQSGAWKDKRPLGATMALFLDQLHQMFRSSTCAKYVTLAFFIKVNVFLTASNTSSVLEGLLQIQKLPKQVVSVSSADSLIGLLGSIQNQQCYLLFLFDYATISLSELKSITHTNK